MVIRALLRPLFLLAILSLVLPSLVAAQGVDVKTVGMVVPASKTDLGWNQQGADGLTAVAKELGITAKIQENGGYDDITPALKDLKDDGAQLIICHASGYQTVCPEFAAAEQVPVAVIENPKAVVAESRLRHRDPGAGGCLPGRRAGRADDQDADGRDRRLRRAADLELHDGRLRRGSQGQQRQRQAALQRDRRGCL